MLMRFLLVTCLALGLAPGLGEIVEAVVHLATSGHMAHTAADNGDLGDQGDEHGCGTTQHRCACCVSQVVAAAPASAVVASAVVAGEPVPTGLELASLHEPAQPHRPPISS